MRLRYFLLPLFLLGGAMLLAACEDEGGPGEDIAEEEDTTEEEPAEEEQVSVDATLADFQIDVTEDTVDTGEVLFNVENTGSVPHNMYVVRSDEPPGELAEGALDVSQLDVVANTEDLEAGASTELEATLEPGSYVLVCTIPGHYEAGMFKGFTVQ